MLYDLNCIQLTDCNVYAIHVRTPRRRLKEQPEEKCFKTSIIACTNTRVKHKNDGTSMCSVTTVTIVYKILPLFVNSMLVNISSVFIN